MESPARKVCILGAAGVGKTSLANRFLTNTCSDHYLSTVGVKVGSRTLALGDGGTMKLVIWDIAGAEEMSSIYANYVRGSSGIVLAADGLRRETLTVALNLYRRLFDLLGPLPSLLLINKVDRLDAWEISDRELISLQRLDLSFMKTSAKEGISVDSAFASLANAMQRR